MVSEKEFWGREPDDLNGTVNPYTGHKIEVVDLRVAAEKARLVREALEALAGEAYAAGEPREGAMFDALALLGSDAALAKLGRLLK